MIKVLANQKFGYNKEDEDSVAEKFHNFYYDQWKKKKQDKINELKEL